MPLLESRNLSHAYLKRKVLNDVSFGLERGEIVGLFGPNGAGKSTLFRLLTGLSPVSEGEIIFDKQRVATSKRTINDRMRARVGVVFQHNSLDVKLSGRQNLELSGALYGLKCADIREQIKKGAAALKIEDLLDKPVKTLSGGTQRKVELIRALLHRPEIVFLDEPSAGFDIEAFKLFWDYILELRRGFGLSVLIATHRPEEGMKCDRLLVLNQGRVVAFETPSQLLARIKDDQVVVKIRAGQESVNDQKLQALCDAHAGLHAFELSQEGFRFACEDGASMAPRILEALPQGVVESVYIKRPSLDDIFLLLTGSRLHDDGENNGL